jgi:hypothetical protein
VAPKPRDVSSLSSSFVSLFDGKRLIGFEESQENKGSWGVEDGMLVLRGGTNSQNTRHGVLVSTRNNYKNCKLRATLLNTDGKCKQIYFRVSDERESGSGYGVSIGGPLDAVGRNIPAGSIFRGDHRVEGGGLNWDTLASTRPTPIGQLQTIEIKIVGNHVTTIVDNKPAAEYLDPDGLFEIGKLALVCRADAIVAFKEILIQELNEKGEPLTLVAATETPDRQMEKDAFEAELKAKAQRNSLSSSRWTSRPGTGRYFDLKPDGTIVGMDGDVCGSWKFNGSFLTFRWPNSAAPGGAWIDQTTISDDGSIASGKNQVGYLAKYYSVR